MSKRKRKLQKIEETTYLYEIAKVLTETIDLRKSLYSVLEILSRSLGMRRGTITILNPLRDEIQIEVAHGLSRSAMQRGRYKPGEGITGKVIQQGKSLVVPKISEEPSFLNRTASRRQTQEEISFICVPIKKGQQVVGSLSVDLPYDDSVDLKASEKLLTVIATMLAQWVINLETLQIEKEALHQENLRLQEQLASKHRITNIIGNSNKMREVFQMISQVCRSNATVLLRGESGTGKELVANAIHYNSPRAKNTFIKVNCAALPSTLIESELFGHEKGAFTGAIKQKRGKFELANKGTIFLDEIGSIGLDVQANLLRVLQEKEFERVGGTQTIKVDVRIIAATSKNYAGENNKDIRRLSTPAIDMLMQYHWPGNVRELENSIERAVLLCEGGVIRSYHLPPTLQTGEQSDTVPTRSLEEATASLEREMIIDALKNTRGNMATAAELLQTTVRKFTYKAKKYGVDYRQYR
jgi:Nif-specific regulatory protein